MDSVPRLPVGPEFTDAAGPEVYMPNAAALFDEAGKLKNADTQKIVATLLEALDKWIGRFKHA